MNYEDLQTDQTLFMTTNEWNRITLSTLHLCPTLSTHEFPASPKTYHERRKKLQANITHQHYTSATYPPGQT